MFLSKKKRKKSEEREYFNYNVKYMLIYAYKDVKFYRHYFYKILLSRNKYGFLSSLSAKKLNDGKYFRILPFLNREIFQFGHATPMFFRHKGDKYLREVHPGNEEGKRYHQHEQDPLIGTEFADVRQKIVEVYVLGLLRIVLLIAVLAVTLRGRKSGLGRG